MSVHANEPFRVTPHATDQEVGVAVVDRAPVSMTLFRATPRAEDQGAGVAVVDRVPIP